MPQSQQSLQEQLRTLIQIANKEGLYDAADYIRDALESQARTRMKATLTSGQSLQVLINDMNPRQRRIVDRITDNWTQVYMSVQSEDLRYFERLGLIELRQVTVDNLPRWEARRIA